MFYTNPIPLDKQAHKNYKLKKLDSYSYAQDSNSLPVAGFEFFEASRSFPIFFVKNKEQGYIPIAILSLRKKGHELGPIWKDVYVPAYVRRYPFVLSSDGTVMFDEAAPQLQEEEGEALFTEEGELTQSMTDIVNFLKTVDDGYRQTEEFVKALVEKDVVEPFKGQIKTADGAINLGDLHVINEKKLHEALSDQDVTEWFKKGWIAWSHAHLHSIGSLSLLVKRASEALRAEGVEEAPAEV